MNKPINKISRFRFIWIFLVLPFLALLASPHPPAGFTQVSPARQLESIGPVIEEAIEAGKCPGAVVLIGHDGKVVYRRAFGNRSVVPRKSAMTADTIFDMASLTKVIATTPAVMQLVDEGKIRLEDRVSEYWPEFKANGKEDMTIRELMTHFSGLRGDLPLDPEWSGYDTALKLIVAEKPIAPPGTRFIYSDINFETLGEIVHRLTGQTLDAYSDEHIFKPLGMKDTRFKPLQFPGIDRERIAPTQYQHGTTGKMLWGEVHDPTSYNMGGVAGHAGLFSTADDLSIYAQMILNGGTLNGVRILSAAAVKKMTSPATPYGKTAVRGLGWDIDSPFSSNRGELFPVGSFGHSGFTGTSIWIDPLSKTYVILLTNAVHPIGKGNVIALRSKVATIAAAAFGVVPTKAAAADCPTLTSYCEMANSYRERAPQNGKVETGLDVLESENYAALRGLRVGLVTNHSGVDSAGRRNIDLLAGAPGVKLTAIFSPEHGLAGTADERVASTVETKTKLPVYSLYGETLRPTEKMLAGLDALVFDIQDAGVRFYTYSTTLGYVLEAAGQKKIPVFVLDRPNPITGFYVEGPILDADLHSFVGYFSMPVRHGMTFGELAEMFNQENKLGAPLHVIKMRGWERTEWLDETGVRWINPSPNLRNLIETTLYPGVGMVEGANLSVGRGTDTPFEVLGAPWIDGAKLAEYLNSRQIQGVRFLSVNFTPHESRFSGITCHGIQFVLLDRQALDSPELGVELAAALYKLFPNDFQLDKTLALVGTHEILEGIKQGRDPRRMAYDWEQHGLEAFREMRRKYLLYP
ncbi:MAG TPA: exo-beta-N-acetylmuramidase NamZ domain-containing protein [Terriglobia bacterium]|nr:exo-beta-N-acetylmuramidase NamZ domain-containing protein [Terriglobia bacterium]